MTEIFMYFLSIQAIHVRGYVYKQQGLRLLISRQRVTPYLEDWRHLPTLISPCTKSGINIVSLFSVRIEYEYAPALEIW